MRAGRPKETPVLRSVLARAIDLASSELPAGAGAGTAYTLDFENTWASRTEVITHRALRMACDRLGDSREAAN